MMKRQYLIQQSQGLTDEAKKWLNFARPSLEYVAHFDRCCSLLEDLRKVMKAQGFSYTEIEEEINTIQQEYPDCKFRSIEKDSNLFMSLMPLDDQ